MSYAAQIHRWPDQASTEPVGIAYPRGEKFLIRAFHICLRISRLDVAFELACKCADEFVFKNAP
jgi:hypothetical protein